MKLLNIDSEIAAIKTLCSGNEKIAGHLMSRISKDHFYYEPATEAFHRILNVARSTGELPTMQEICADPTINEETRKVLKKTEVPAVKDPEKVPKLISTLDKYKKLRGLYFHYEEGLRQLQESKVDLDGLIDRNSDVIMKLRVNSDAQHTLKHLGKGNNTTSLVKTMLGRDSPPVIKTGFKEFDQKNGGFFHGALAVFAATTGGGKSLVADQLSHNIPLVNMNTDCCLVSLEMTDEDCMARKLARLAHVNVNKFQQRTVTDAEAKKVKRKYASYVNTLKENNSRSTIFSPREDMSIEEILFTLKPYGYKIIIIDYISLLKGMDGDDQWRQLGNAARFAKVWAKSHNIVVVLLAQLDENNPNQVRYARAIKEHANNFWAWTCTDENKESGLLEIRQLKARNQDPFPFYLGVQFEYMEAGEPDSNQLDKQKSSEDGVKNTKKLDKLERKVNSNDDYLSDVSDVD